MLIRGNLLTFGSVSKTGPIKRSTKRIRPQQMKVVICVTPPTASWIKERDKEAAMGAHPKKEPKTLLSP